MDVVDDLVQMRVDAWLTAGKIDAPIGNTIFFKINTNGVYHAFSIRQRKIDAVEVCKAVSAMVIAVVGNVKIDDVGFQVKSPFDVRYLKYTCFLQIS